MSTTIQSIVILISLFLGYIIYLCITFLIDKETHHNYYAMHFLKAPILQVLCVLIEIFLYRSQGINVAFFLYSGFASVLLIITYTDFLEETISNIAIGLGLLYALSCQFLIGQLAFALIGGIVGFLISFSIYSFGNHYFTITNVPIEEETNKEVPICIRFAFVPALSIAVLVHALLPKGLGNFLYDIVLFVKSNNLVLIPIVIITMLLLFWIMKQKTFYLAPEAIAEDPSEEESLNVYGSGDVTASIFIGIVLGWQDFIAVFWLATVVFSIVGIILHRKQKGDLKWI
jgi:hypothetical protein